MLRLVLAGRSRSFPGWSPITLPPALVAVPASLVVVLVVLIVVVGPFVFSVPPGRRRRSASRGLCRRVPAAAAVASGETVQRGEPEPADRRRGLEAAPLEAHNDREGAFGVVVVRCCR